MAEGDREHWDERWSGLGRGTAHRSMVIELVRPWLPSSGRALDVGGGGSTESLALAEAGLDVTVVDVSEVGLALARQAAEAAGLSITTVGADVDVDPLPAGPWDVIVVANYLNRDLFGALAAALRPGRGILALAIATVTNLERNPKPARRHVLDAGEIATLLPGLEVLHHSEAWRDNDRHEAHLVARAT
jgi:2-polyprenyl-3-methyl-5-hydroxy-6-metoxy-1,4-benzoquinol methylase